MGTRFFSSLTLPPSQSRKVLSSALKPIIIRGDPPTFVSAPGRRIVAGLDASTAREKSFIRFSRRIVFENRKELFVSSK